MLERYHQLKPLARGIAVDSIEMFRGECSSRCVIKGTVLGSAIEQTITLHNKAPLVHIDTEIDWQERHTVLKAATAVDILADRATYGIQGAVIERPNHFDRLEDHAL